MSDAVEDNLTAYFRDLSEHALLTPGQEHDLSLEIVEVEVETWRAIAARPEVVHGVVAILERDTTARYPKLLSVATEALTSRRTRRDTKVLRRLRDVARDAGTRMREHDLDRVHLDAIIRELEVLNGGDREGEKHMRDVRKRYRAGADLRDRFVRSNLRLVVTMARRYDRGGMALEDLIQEGNLGLMHAVPRFDAGKNFRFSTYACWWIRHAIGRALADKARAIRIPVHMLETQQHVDRTRMVMTGELGRPPTAQELCERAKVTDDKLEQLGRLVTAPPVSLDRPSHDDQDQTMADTIVDPDTEDRSAFDEISDAETLRRLLTLVDRLTPIEQLVIRQRFGLDGGDENLTFREIGDQYGLSRERIRQIQNEALKKLRHAMIDE